ncbi:thioesterase family protein [soil metagenome]
MPPMINVEANGPGLWDCEPEPRFLLPNGAHWGGYALGVLLKSVLLEPSRVGAPMSMTVSYLAPLRNEPMVVSTRLLRKGSSLEFWRAEISQRGDDHPCVHAQITLAQRKPTRRFGWIEMPAAPEPEDVARFKIPVKFLERFDIRPVDGWRPDKTDSNTIEWTGLVEDHPIDEIVLAMLADRFMPRHAFVYGAAHTPSSTISLTIYFHATAAEIAAVGHDFVLTQAMGRSGSDSIFDMHGQIWRRDGVLLITTEQLSWFRERKGETQPS